MVVKREVSGKFLEGECSKTWECFRKWETLLSWGQEGMDVEKRTEEQQESLVKFST